MLAALHFTETTRNAVDQTSFCGGIAALGTLGSYLQGQGHNTVSNRQKITVSSVYSAVL